MPSIPLKISEIREIYNALTQLDGYNMAVKDKDREKIIHVSYDIDGEVRWDIGTNLKVLRPYVDQFEKTRKGIVKQISGGASIKEDDLVGLEKFQEEIDKVLDKTEDIEGLTKLKKADLKPKVNKFSPNQLMFLAPLIEDANKDESTKEDSPKKKKQAI